MNDNVPSIPKVDENMLIDLSQDIKVKIYNDNFHIKHDCDELIKWFNKNSSLHCSAKEVEDLTNKILDSKDGIEYMKQNNKFFEKYYKKHFVDNEKVFELMNETTSLVTSILMSMWH